MSTTAKITTKESITQGLQCLGVKCGDTLFVQSNLSMFKRIKGNPVDTILGGFMDAIGSEGTLVVPAYTQASLKWKKQSTIFEEKAKPYTGALPQMLLRRGEAIRSRHPTHSVLAVGANAHKIVEGHDENSYCFAPLSIVKELDGLQALIGCTRNTPGMPTVHLAQYELGLSQRHYSRLLYSKPYKDSNGNTKNYKLPESPGCSLGFGKQYGNYLESENLSVGYVATAWSAATRVRAAYSSDIKLLEQNPRSVLCDRKLCASCSLRGYNKRSVVPYLFGASFRFARNRLSVNRK